MGARLSPNEFGIPGCGCSPRGNETVATSCNLPPDYDLDWDYVHARGIAQGRPDRCQRAELVSHSAQQED